MGKNIKGYYKQASKNKWYNNNKISLKQKNFADLYIETGNITQSYLDIYGGNIKSAESNGNRLIRNDKVRFYIDSIMKQKEKEKIASQNEILELLTKHARGQTTEECLNVVGIGDHCSEVVSNEKVIVPKDRIKALELLGKRYGIWDSKDREFKKKVHNDKQSMDNKKFEQDKQIHADKMAIEKEKASNDTGLPPVVFIENSDKYLEWKKKNESSST